MWLFLRWFYFREFRESELVKISIFNLCLSINENRKITKLSPREFPHLLQNRENICTQKLWRIQYMYITTLSWQSPLNLYSNSEFHNREVILSFH